jgi:hypothetical protein
LIKEINEKTDKFQSELENLLNKNRRDLTSIEKSAAVSKMYKSHSYSQTHIHINFNNHMHTNTRF